MKIQIPIPGRYRRAQILATVCRIFAILIFIISLAVGLTLTSIGEGPEQGFFGDTISRITGDRLDVAVAVSIYVMGVMTILGGLYSSFLLYMVANILNATVHIEHDVEVIKGMLETQVGEKAATIEETILKEIGTARFIIKPVRIAVVAIISVVLCGVIYMAIGLYLPSEEGASDFIAANNCVTSDPDDSDCDGISNELEIQIAETFVPTFVYDNDERNIIIDSEDFVEFRDVVYLYQVSPVHCNRDRQIVESDGYDDVLLTVVATYPYDYVPLGVEEEEELDVLDHLGDTERIQLCLSRIREDTVADQHAVEAFDIEESVVYRIEFIHINRHESFNTYSSWSDLTWDNDTHLVLYVSEGKHASYISQKECAAHPRNITALAYHEDCTTLEDAEIVLRPTLTGLNVGQLHAQLINTTDDLPEPANMMFELDEVIWQDTLFCGGYPPGLLIEMGQGQVQPFVDGADDQTLAILDTLLPFIDLETGRVSDVCSSSLYSKWWKYSTETTLVSTS